VHLKARVHCYNNAQGYCRNSQLTIARFTALTTARLAGRALCCRRRPGAPGALCRFLGVAEAPLTSTRRSSTSGINEVTEYRDDDGSSIAV